MHVEVADDAPQCQRARPGLKRVELIGGIAAADQRAHRGADDDVGRNPVRLQRAHDADMGETARRAAAEHEPDRRPATFEGDLTGVDRFACNLDSYSLHPRDLGPSRRS